MGQESAVADGTTRPTGGHAGFRPGAVYGSVVTTTEQEGVRRNPSRPLRTRLLRAALRTLLVLLVLLVVDAAWVGVRGVLARRHLTAARVSLTDARDALVAGHDAGAVLDRARHETAAARRLTGDPVWHLDGHLPVVGSTFQTAAVVAEQGERLAAALPAVSAGVEDLRRGGLLAGRRIDLRRLATDGAGVVAADDVLRSARAAVGAAPAHPAVHAVEQARADLLGLLSDAQARFDGIATAVRVAPAMLGADGPRRYFAALQNTAEARGTGGLMGTWAVLLADHGALTLQQKGSDADLPDFGSPVLDPAPDFAARWGQFHADTIWRDANASPHFPWAAQVWLAMWQARRHEHLDGVISLDPTAAGYLVAATRPVRLTDGSTIAGPDLTEFAESRLYARYPRDADSTARRAVLVGLVGQLFDHLGQPTDTRALLSALGRAAGERRLLLASARPQEQSLLETTPVAGVLPDVPGPFAGIALFNGIGNKMDYYLDRTVTWTAGPCAAPGAARTVTTSVTLHDDAPTTPLPPYVAKPTATGQRSRPDGSNRSWVSVYGSVGAVAVRATLDGHDVPVATQSERGHPVVAAYVDLAPRQSGTLVVTWQDPSRGAPAPVLLPPLVRDPVVHADVGTCP